MTLDVIKILGGATIALAVYLGLIEHPRAKQTTINVTIQLIIQDTTQMPFGIDEILSGLVGTVLNTGGQVAAQEMDFRNQTRLMERQNQYYQDNARLQQGLALDTWEKTGYGAQAKQMRDAGLNVGLMYKGAGGGGGTVQSPGGAQPTVSGPPKFDAGLALQLGLNTAKTQAEIDNIKADTAVKTAQAPETQARTKWYITDTGLKELDAKGKELENEFLRIRNNTAAITQPDAIARIQAESQKAIQDTHTAKLQNQILDQTYQARIQEIRLGATEATLRIALQQQNLVNLKATKEQIDKQVEEITARIEKMLSDKDLSWENLDNERQRTEIQSRFADYAKEQTTWNTGTGADVARFFNSVFQGAQAYGNLQVRK